MVGADGLRERIEAYAWLRGGGAGEAGLHALQPATDRPIARLQATVSQNVQSQA